MPVYLIVRLIGYESGRQEALQFIREQVTDGKRLLAYLKELPQRTLSFIRSLHLKRQSWLRQDNLEDEENSQANGTPILSSYGAQNDKPSE